MSQPSNEVTNAGFEENWKATVIRVLGINGAKEQFCHQNRAQILIIFLTKAQIHMESWPHP